ncbi:hypothetical protein BDN70DRAFT_702813 [Pholiota conissans]|uniref:Uncharacterized protein n=1 Tax=Pholiota conissans TaxID=109636 RepID=A0A9P5Z496_9AGAR|nr:hypothetical protein BDN70DRAFT_702813 [Pholiota conissans]
MLLSMSLHLLLLPLVALFFGIKPVNGGIVTLYYVSKPTITTDPTPAMFESVEVEGTTIASAIGPGDAGMTRYEIQQIQSKLVLHGETETVTLLSEPLTVTYTIEQGASAAYVSAPPLVTHKSFGQISFQGLKENCTLDIFAPGGTGVCVAEEQDPKLVFGTGDATSTSISTSTSTFTGPLFPLATVITSDSISTSKFTFVRGAPILFVAILAMIVL